MTLAEATDWLAHAVATSTVLSKLFGVQFAFGELSAYQRQKMPTVRLFELGLLRPADVKYTVAFESSKVLETASDATLTPSTRLVSIRDCGGWSFFRV